MIRATVVLLVLSGVASAKPPPSGVYVVDRKGPATVYTGPKGLSQRIPDCHTAESQPIPQTLRIEYSRVSPVATVNTEQWDVAGLTTDSDGKPVKDPWRVVTKSNPPPALDISVWFIRTKSTEARAVMMVIARDKDMNPTCTVAYHFEGTYRP